MVEDREIEQDLRAREEGGIMVEEGVVMEEGDNPKT